VQNAVDLEDEASKKFTLTMPEKSGDCQHPTEIGRKNPQNQIRFNTCGLFLASASTPPLTGR
jgi:hypothetical protein